MFDPFVLLKDLVINFWWTFTPIVLFFILFQLWMRYIQMRYESRLSWVLLEIKLPREIAKTPKTMELIFSVLHGAHSEPNITEKYIDGKTPTRFSLEVVGINGVTHFYIRTEAKFRNLVEAQIYAQYSEAEIHEAEDYTINIPPDVPNKDFDLWGTEMILSKPDAYPIRTYFYFEDPEDERRMDPLASLTEFFSKLEEGSQMWLQFIVTPAPNTWQEAGHALVKKLTGQKEETKKGMFDDVFGDLFHDLSSKIDLLVWGTVSSESPPQQKRESEISRMMHLSPGQRDAVKAIEENIAKLGFFATVRIIYTGKNDVFTKANVAGIIGAFRQFNTLNLNGFKLDSSKTPSVDYLFKKMRNFARSRSLFQNYKKRKMDLHPFVLNTEELATVYHFPGKMVAPAPLLQRVEAKKGEPPPGLPTG